MIGITTCITSKSSLRVRLIAKKLAWASLGAGKGGKATNHYRSLQQGVPERVL